MDRIQINGVEIDNVTLDEAVKFALLEREYPCTVVTPNAVMLEACRHNPEFADLLNRATLSLPDGAGVVWEARRKGTPLRERVAGIEFGETLCSVAEQMMLSVFFLGGREGVAERAAFRLQEKYPYLKVVGAAHGYFEKEGGENAAVLQQLQAVKPDILFVCFGFPMQEQWLFQNISALPFLRIAACLGGSLDVWSGGIKRAPKMLSRFGLEWAWRMLREPKRLKQLPSLLRFAIKN